MKSFLYLSQKLFAAFSTVTLLPLSLLKYLIHFKQTICFSDWEDMKLYISFNVWNFSGAVCEDAKFWVLKAYHPTSSLAWWEALIVYKGACKVKYSPKTIVFQQYSRKLLLFLPWYEASPLFHWCTRGVIRALYFPRVSCKIFVL